MQSKRSVNGFGLGDINLISHFYFRMALLIYTPTLNSRIKYVFEHIFENILGVGFAFCVNEKDYIAYNGPKLSYGIEVEKGGIFFARHDFMLALEIKKQDLAFADFNQDKIPFLIDKGIFPFDVFAASFYFLSRYEEYIITERDQHQRFEGKSSLAYQLDFIKRPIIDEWALAIAGEIQKKYPQFEIADKKFQFIPTLDIDRPYYFKTDSFLKKTLKKLLLGFKADPFDVYQQVANWDQKFKLKTIYFILMGNKHPNDSAPSVKNKHFIEAIRTIKSNHQVGIHPSYYSHLHPELISEEKNNLSEIISEKITISRQHYLLLSLPDTYRNLISNGIKEDFTLAFADIAGFRASTCTPFFWYDLAQEEISSLYLYPTAVMDQTLKKYLGLNPQEAIQLIEELMENVKIVSGTFISLWHNESVNDFRAWKGWKTVYLTMLEKANKINQSES